MAECGICIEPLFTHAHASSQPTASLGEPLDICTLPCGHVFHEACCTRWFSSNGRLSKKCPHCREVITSQKGPTKLVFGGDPWAPPVIHGNIRLKENVRSLKRTAAGGIGVDSTGAEVESFVNRLQGVMDDLSNAKGKGREDDWLDLMEDEELRTALQTLSQNVSHLRDRLHYSHRITSLCETITKLQDENRALTDAQQASAEDKLNALQELKTKALGKMAREKARWKEKEKDKEASWREEERRLKLEIRLKDDKLMQVGEERKKLVRDLTDVKESLNTRLAALESQNTKIADLKKKLLIQKQAISTTDASNASLTSQLLTAKAIASSLSATSRLAPNRPRLKRARDKSDEYDDSGLGSDGELGERPTSEMSEPNLIFHTSDAVEDEAGRRLKGDARGWAEDKEVIWVGDSDDVVMEENPSVRSKGKGVEGPDDSLEVADVSWRSQIEVPVRKPAKLVYQSNSRAPIFNATVRPIRADANRIDHPSRFPNTSASKFPSTSTAQGSFSFGPRPVLCSTSSLTSAPRPSFASGPRHQALQVKLIEDARKQALKNADRSRGGLVATGPKVKRRAQSKVL